MATIPQTKPKHEPPPSADLEWLVKDMWSDLKELRDIASRVGLLEKSVYVVGGILATLYCLQHLESVINAVAKWLGIA